MGTNREANQAKLDRLMQEAQWRIPVGKVNARGGIWNGSVWVYGLQSREHREWRRQYVLRGE